MDSEIMAAQFETSRTNRGETSLDAAMRAPSTTAPDVVVLSFLDEDVKIKEVADPKKDLWVSSIDGYVKVLSLAILWIAHPFLKSRKQNDADFTIV